MKKPSAKTAKTAKAARAEQPARFLYYGDAARVLKCSVRTVRRYVAVGKLEKFVSGRGIVLVSEDAVRKLLRFRSGTIYL